MNIDSTITLRSGNKIPIIGLGSWQLTENTEGCVANALELGYRLFDTSSDYGSQPGIGEGIKKSQASRDSLYIVTKVEEDDNSYERTKSNLRELKLDYVDLMLIHRPPEDGTAGKDLWEGLIRAKKEGLTKDIGVSNYSPDLIDQLIEASGEIPVVNQIEWSPFGFSEKMKQYCEDNEIVIQAYSPLTRGKRLNDETLKEIADKYKKTPAQILIRWNLQQGTIPLIKAGSRSHRAENIDVFDFNISPEDMEKLNNLNEEFSALGSIPKYLELDPSFQSL